MVKDCFGFIFFIFTSILKTDTMSLQADIMTKLKEAMKARIK